MLVSWMAGSMVASTAYEKAAMKAGVPAVQMVGLSAATSVVILAA